MRLGASQSLPHTLRGESGAQLTDLQIERGARVCSPKKGTFHIWMVSNVFQMRLCSSLLCVS